MSKKQDPAFLFYSKDWLEGTAEMFPEEKGVYIDLLCHQHQKGGLPNDVRRLARMVGLSVDEFSPIWENLSCHFELMEIQMVNLSVSESENQTENQVVNQTVKRLANRKLNQVVNERYEYAKKNVASGTFASQIKVFSKQLSKKQITEIKQKFNVNDFCNLDKSLIKSRVKEWFNQTVNQMVNNLEDEDAIVNKDKEVTKEDIKEIVSLFHKNCKDLPRIQIVSDARKDAIKARHREHGFLKIHEVIKKTGESDFLCSRNEKKFKANFDWILNPNNFLKILEGNYDNRKSQSNNSKRVIN